MNRVMTLLAILLAACDPLVDGDYAGEARWSFEGTVAIPAGTGAPLRGMALLWQDAEGAGGPGKVISRVPVEVTFPVDFRLDLPQPPPSDVMFRLAAGEPRLAEGYLYGLTTSRGPFDLDDVVGVDQEHALVYVQDEVVEGTLAAAYLGGPVGRGYHVRDLHPTDELSPAQAELVGRCPEPERCAAIRRYQLAPPAGGERLRLTLRAGGDASAR